MPRRISFNPKFEPTPASEVIAENPKWWQLDRKRALILASAIFLSLVMGWFLVKAAMTARRIITENTGGSAPFLSGILGDVDWRQLKGEGDGRINILLLGMGGEGHTAPNLTDTIIVLSIDPQEKNAAMLSIPRDLQVYVGDNYGYGKINSVYAYGEQDNYPGGGGAFLKEKVSEILDLPMHYYARLDFDGFKKMVNTVDGVTIDVEKEIYDYSYPDENMQGYDPFFITKGTHKMDGNVALKYARSRYTTSDFDRAKRQQQVLSALREKALKVNFISNPAKISEVLDILGDHLRTDIQLWEMQKLYELSKEIDPSTMVNKVLDNSADGFLTASQSSGGAYILVPRAGDFSEIQRFVHEIFVDSYIKKENTRLTILNGTHGSGLAASVSEMLKSYGYNVVKSKNAKNKNYTQCVLYDYTNNSKPYTLQYLASRFGARIESATPKEGQSEEMVLILGSDYQNPTESYYLRGE
ncbi:LCP family protein [Patescibacteria group bacterium]